MEVCTHPTDMAGASHSWVALRYLKGRNYINGHCCASIVKAPEATVPVNKILFSSFKGPSPGDPAALLGTLQIRVWQNNSSGKLVEFLENRERGMSFSIA